MYYATHRLHIKKGNPLMFQVVKVEHGRVVSFFDFTGELQSMFWVDEIVISENGFLGPGFSLDSLPDEIPDVGNLSLSAFSMISSPADGVRFVRLG